jgi:hypothetical protein
VYQFWMIFTEEVGVVRCQYVNLAMEVSESHERCVIHKHVRTKLVKCTTAIVEAHLAQTTPTISKTCNFRTVDERRASGLNEPLAP